MKKNIGFVILGLLLILATVVVAWTLRQERQVMTCADTDGGLNEFVQGTSYGLDLNMNQYSRTDYCTNYYNLMEFACDNSTMNATYAQAWMHNCNTTNTTRCLNGACISELGTCFDSDGGINVTVFGTVNGTYVNGTAYEYDDYCTSSTYLKEWACTNNIPTQSGHFCSAMSPPRVCQSGACV